MRKLIIASATCMAMNTIAFSASAAESATLTVTGTITPAACDVSLSNSTIALGTMSVASLPNKVNETSPHYFSMAVSCDAAAAVAIQTTDNRASSALTPAEWAAMGVASNFTNSTLFGLGNDTDGNKIGSLFMVVTGATIDSTATTNILSSSDKATWSSNTVSASSPLKLSKDDYISLAATGSSTTPVTFTNATFMMAMTAGLKKGDKYPTGENVAIDGNVTFSVVYL